MKVENDLIKYFTTKPLFPDSVCKIEDNIFTYKDIHITTELENLIFSFNYKIEVLEPKNFRNKIREKIKKMKEKYYNN